MKRRDFIKWTLGGLATLLSGGCFLREKKPIAVTTLDAQSTRQIITTDPQTSRCLMFQTAAKSANTRLEYRRLGDDEIFSIDSADSGFIDGGTEVIQYTATIDNLSPDDEYEYRFVTDDTASDWHAIHPIDENNFKAIIFPDSQSSDYNVWRDVAQSAAKLNSDAAFFVNMGDIVDNGEDHTQWRAWLNGVEGLIENIPFVPIMGNHETYNLDWKERLPVAYLNYFVAPNNGSKKFARYFYSFNVGAVHFVVLNTQWDEVEKFQSGLIEEQTAWLKQDMTKNRRPFNIALLHKDVLQYRIKNRPERVEGFSPQGEVFMPLFDELGFDVVFTAHLHTYRNRGHIRDFKRDEDGALYILTGVAGDVRYPGLWIDHALDVVTAPQPEVDNFLTLEVNADRLLIKSFLPDGKEIDSITVKKRMAR